MEKIIWTCIILDVVAGLALFLAILSSGQDAAGKAMILLPILLLLIFAAVGYFLLKANHYTWAIVITGVPAAIVILILVFTVLQGFKNR